MKAPKWLLAFFRRILTIISLIFRTLNTLNLLFSHTQKWWKHNLGMDISVHPFNAVFFAKDELPWNDHKVIPINYMFHHQMLSGKVELHSFCYCVFCVRKTEFFKCKIDVLVLIVILQIPWAAAGKSWMKIFLDEEWEEMKSRANKWCPWGSKCPRVPHFGGWHHIPCPSPWLPPHSWCGLGAWPPWLPGKVVGQRGGIQ